MKLTCPNCSTHFSVPDKALLPNGRMLKCARCQHKWFEPAPESATGSMNSGQSAPAARPQPAPAAKPQPAPAKPRPVVMPEPEPEPAAAGLDAELDDVFESVLANPPRSAAPAAGSSAMISLDDIPLEMPPAKREAKDQPAQDINLDDIDLDALMKKAQGGKSGDDDDDDIFGSLIEERRSTDDDMNDMLSDMPEPIPDVFSSPPLRKANSAKGSGALVGLLLFLLLAAAGGAAFYFQEDVVDAWPEAAQYYEMLGLRQEVIGQGLTFRNYSSERLVQEANEVLIVRGVIANTTDKARDVPLLRLALYSSTDTIVQEKVVPPPARSLDGGGTVGFRITLEQPNPDASRFEVTFTPPDPAAK